MYAVTDFPVAQAMTQKITSDLEVRIVTECLPLGCGYKEDEKGIRMRKADSFDPQFLT